MSTTNDHLAARRQSDEALASALGAALPPDWPPEHIDEGFWTWVKSHLNCAPCDDGWLNWFVLYRDQLAGTAGFKGPPDVDGVVEIGYAIVPSLQMRGIAPIAVRLLCDHACGDPSVTAIAAETLASNRASIAVAERCGFALHSSYDDPDEGPVLRFMRWR